MFAKPCSSPEPCSSPATSASIWVLLSYQSEMLGPDFIAVIRKYLPITSTELLDAPGIIHEMKRPLPLTTWAIHLSCSNRKSYIFIFRSFISSIVIWAMCLLKCHFLTQGPPAGQLPSWTSQFGMEIPRITGSHDTPSNHFQPFSDAASRRRTIGPNYE